MYAIIRSGGKQYRVKKGDIIDVDLLGLSAEEKAVEFRDVLFLNDGKENVVGAPCVENCLVMGELLGEAKGPKVISFKFKRRKDSRRKIGHRQRYSRVKITEIQAN